MTTGKVGKWLGGVLVLCLVIGGLGLSCAPKAPEVEELVIGVGGPLAFDVGRDIWRGAVVAYEEINELGGVSIKGTKVPIRLVKIDTNEWVSVPDAAVALEKAITVDKIYAYVGTNRTEAALAMMDISSDYKTIFMAGNAGVQNGERVRDDYEKYKYTFRSMTPNSNVQSYVSYLQVHFAACQLKEQLGIEKPKVAIFMEKLTWNEPMAEQARKELPKLGVEVVGTWRPASTAEDVTAELLAIKDAGANVIYQAFSGPVSVPFMKQWAGLEIPAVIAGTMGPAMEASFWPATDGKCNYVMTWLSLPSLQIPATDKTMPYVNRYKEKYDELPGAYSIMGHGGVWLLKEAIELAGTTDVDAVIKALETHEFVTAAGIIKFDPTTHEWTFGKGYTVLGGMQWQDGEMKCVWPTEYEGCLEEWKFEFEGTVDYKIPPWVKEYWQGKS